VSDPLSESPGTSFNKQRIKVLLLEGIHESAASGFESVGYSNVDLHAGALPADHLPAALADTFILGIRSRTRVTRELLDAAPRLLAVGCFCIGTNQIDLDAAHEKGIPVFNAPFSNTRSVAELVLAEVILLLRGIPRRNSLAHRGIWAKSASGAHEARGKTLGIVGYGHIGSQTGLLAESLGMRVIYHDVVTKLALGNATPLRGLDDLLEAADVVTLHVPETPETDRMIGAAELSKMKRGAALVNASRGTVVEIEALAEALESEHLSGAAIDVYPVEPRSGEDEFVSPLRNFDNVILTPHIGGSTAEAQESIGLEVAEKLIRYSDNGSTLSAVNFPEVSLPGHAGKHRLLHIHRNQPGVLSQVNGIFSEHEINVAAQYLQTSGEIGYVVIDVDPSGGADTQALRRALDRIEGTIRTRLLY
jgi:D-3-phosphoglycerate dehydrogenase / 2-oxoglutarate reductase